MNFAVVDVETANADLSSICQVGIALYQDGAMRDSFESLINPEDEFDGFAVSIHGITEEKVRLAPKWPEVFPQIAARLHGNIVASHTAFDRISLLRASEKYALQNCDCRWLDSAMVVRRAWPIFSRAGYGLSNVAREFGISYRAHDALQDARCAGEILLRAIADTGLSIDAWMDRVKKPIHLPAPKPAQHAVSDHGDREENSHVAAAVAITRHGNPDGPLYGEVLVFTGALAMPRHEAADAAAIAGCEVVANVSNRTTVLVVGDQDVRKMRGQGKSTKHRKAEELIAKGAKIRIISETDFDRIVNPRSAIS